MGDTKFTPEQTFEVIKYFDDHYDGIVRTGLTKQEAEDLRNKLSDRPSAYYSYSIREVAPQITQ